MWSALALAAILASPPPGFVVVRVLATADLHGRIAPGPDFDAPGFPRRQLGGWPGLARVLRDERPADALLVDCGDFAFGSPEANATHGRSQVRFMNLVGYDAAALGARDFAEGTRELELLAGLAAFPLLADPMLDVVLNRRVPLFRPYAVRTVAGVRVGLIGLSDPRVPELNLPDHSRGFAPDDPLDQCQRYLSALAGESCDVRVAFGHIRTADAARILDSVPGLDLLLCPEDGGETRERLVTVADHGRRVAVAELLYNRATRQVDELRSHQLNVIPEPAATSPCSSLVREFAVSGMDSVVAWAPYEMSLTPAGPRQPCAGQAVAEAARRAADAHICLLPPDVVESGLPDLELTRRRLYDCAPHRERLRLAALNDTELHLLLGALPGEGPAPHLAGADLFILGDTATWPLSSQVCRVRYRDGTGTHRVVAPTLLYQQAGLADMGRLLPDNLTELWLRQASERDTLGPVGWPRLLSATVGLVPVPPPDSSPVNINTAGLEELQRLPGVGPATAERIIAHRLAHGRFATVDDLRNVKGIGPGKLEKIRPLATVR